MSGEKLGVEMQPPGSIRENERNSKTHPEEQLRDLMLSIMEFGFRSPLLVSEDGVLISGHGRLEAARRLGLKAVPVVRVPLSGTDAAAFGVADNRLSELSTWDADALGEELKQILADGISLDAVGFADQQDVQPPTDAAAGGDDEPDDVEDDGAADDGAADDAEDDGASDDGASDDASRRPAATGTPADHTPLADGTSPCPCDASAVFDRLAALSQAPAEISQDLFRAAVSLSLLRAVFDPDHLCRKDLKTFMRLKESGRVEPVGRLFRIRPLIKGAEP